MEPNRPTDADLVAETLAGDREAFGQLYDRHARMVRAVVAAVSGDWRAVEDMTQECFLRAFRNLARLRDPALFGAWVVGIARQVGRERRRTLRRNRHEFVDPRDSDILSSASDGEVRVEEREQLSLMMERLAGLPEQERLAIHAFYFDEQDARRAAELVGLSRSGFYALLKRALARLASGPSATKERTKR